MVGDIKTFYFFICLLDREQFIVHFDSPFLIHIITAFFKINHKLPSKFDSNCL
jgi:hypothetical protein